MRRLLILMLAAGAIFTAFVVIQPLREAGLQTQEAGGNLADAAGGVVDAVGNTVDAVGGVIGFGTDAVGQAGDTVRAARELNTACDLVREAVAPGTPPEVSESRIKEAMAIVGGVVTAYPDVPGVGDLERGLKASRKALAADPTGQSLGVTSGQVEEACSQIPPVP